MPLAGTETVYLHNLPPALFGHNLMPLAGTKKKELVVQLLFCLPNMHFDQICWI